MQFILLVISLILCYFSTYNVSENDCLIYENWTLKINKGQSHKSITLNKFLKNTELINENKEAN